MSYVVLVDPDDRSLGTEEKLRVHTLGSLHRAVSVFVCDASGALVIQRRALAKYHSGGLWSNAACTHPRDDETPLTAAQRCLREELGLHAVLHAAFRFRYRAAVPPGLIEHEYDHVFVGTVDGAPNPSPHEVAGWRVVPPDELAQEVVGRPEAFTVWFRLALPLYMRWREQGADRLENPFFDTVVTARNT